MNEYIDRKDLNVLQNSINESPSVVSNVVFQEIWENHAKQFDNKYCKAPSWDKALLPPTQKWVTSLSLTDPMETFKKYIHCNKCGFMRINPEIKKLSENKCTCETMLPNELIKAGKNTFCSAISDGNQREVNSLNNMRDMDRNQMHIQVVRNKTALSNVEGHQREVQMGNQTGTWGLNSNSHTTEGIQRRNRTNNMKLQNIASSWGVDSNNEVAVKEEVKLTISTETDNNRGSVEEESSGSTINKLIFKTAKDQFLSTNPAARRILKSSKNTKRRFVSPMISQVKDEEITAEPVMEGPLKNIDPKMIQLIESEIMDKGTEIAWSDIAGLESAKSVIQEAVVWPLLRPDIFTGLRQPPKGILLFGPPGTGKTLIGKCVAAQCKATFFSISASSLTSKWIGDGEKMVRALFAVARHRQPAVIFIDEIDSLLTQRSDTEHEATMRIKTEFLVQFDGAATDETDRVLLIGATNRPQALDEAARRRLVKRLYIPLPELNARTEIITNLLRKERNSLTESDIMEVSELTHGYSGADMKSLCSEAAMGPIRSVPMSDLATIDVNKVRAVNLSDFKSALGKVKPSVSQQDLSQYVNWNKTYGHGF